MIINNLHKNITTLKRANFSFDFLTSGDIFQFSYNNFMINDFYGNEIDGSLNNVYLRIYENNEIKSFPLLGTKSNSIISHDNNTLTYTGEIEKITYCVTFYLSSFDVWFWDIKLDGKDKMVDIIYGQDVGIASKGGVLVNELYMAQYLGHAVHNASNGYVISSRQNQLMDGKNPYIQQGMVKGNAIAYSTDATQFFGLDYKDNQKIQALDRNLESVNYQFEQSYIALQSEKIKLNGKHNFTFYAIFKDDYKTAVEKVDFSEELQSAYTEFLLNSPNLTILEKIQLKPEFSSPFSSVEIGSENLDKLFPKRILEEYENGKLISFFTEDHSHIVLKEKETLTERPHGNIITTFVNTKEIDNNLITSTNYIYGLFNSHLVIGNTSGQKLLSTQRGLLNALKNSGQRIYLKSNEKYHILAMPSIFEMGLNYSKWYYFIEDDLCIITSYATHDNATITLSFESQNHKKYDLIITNQIGMAEHEFSEDFTIDQKDEKTFVFSRLTPCSVYKDLSYQISFDKEVILSDDGIFFTNEQPLNKGLICFKLSDVSDFKMNMSGILEKSDNFTDEFADFETEKKTYLSSYKKLLNGFYLSGDAKNEELLKLNATAYWYAHNAMVHFAVPHGLEQPGGAAWGTRDVCQGPFEFFLCTGNFEMIKSVIKNLFSHQNLSDGEWPQWFMFDKFKIFSDECHGDVIFWPLKCISEYLSTTADYSILEEKLSYLDSENKQTLFEHLKLCLNSIEKRFIEKTKLISYAGGDWDDTLQPVKKEMKERMVSAWTQVLAYQSIHNLGKSMLAYNEEFSSYLTKMAEEIKNDFNTHLVKNSVISGFVLIESDGSLTNIIHPEDKLTGISYRLLPHTRSIISEIISKEQAIINREIIEKHLKYPDGAHLIDKPTTYSGGVSKMFVRAEQAANIGREISSNYIHAHIRYIEAMAKLGKSTDSWNGLFTINPIKIKDSVKNASTRQSNLYFSSSDPCFNDRYDFSENFDKVKDGTVSVKGGWRLYSSGPGIYLNQLISNVLGIRLTSKGVIIDPCLPISQNNLNFTFECFGKEIKFIYNFSDSDELSCNLNHSQVQNKYKRASIFISKEDLLSSNGEVLITYS